MRLFALIASVVFIVSCEEQPIYMESMPIDNHTWTHDDSLDFNLELSDTLIIHDMHLILEHAPDYDYENIYLKILTSFPDGRRLEERLSIDLAESSGQWIGRCTDNTCRLKVYLLENFRFPQHGPYRFTFFQETREDSLMGIQSLQLELYKAETTGS